MAAKPKEPDLNFLADLADHAHKLIREFIDLPLSEREHTTELLFEIEHIIAEFKRLRPPPTFGQNRRLRLVESNPEPVCGICFRPVDRSSDAFTETTRTIYHLICLDGFDLDNDD
jgi:hypothetical protein